MLRRFAHWSLCSVTNLTHHGDATVMGSSIYMQWNAALILLLRPDCDATCKDCNVEEWKANRL